MTTPKTLATMPEGVRASTGRCVKEVIYRTVLARLKEHQDAYEDCGEFRFDPTEDIKGDKRWDSFENATAKEEDRETKIVHPIVISTDAAMALIAPLIEACNAVVRLGAIPAVDTINALIESRGPGSGAIAAMAAVRAHMAPVLKTELMAREFDSVRTFRDKISALVSAKAFNAKGALEIARLYVAFLRAVAWFAGNAAWETRKYTFNLEQALLILTNLQVCLPGDPLIPALVCEVKEQVFKVISAQDLEAAAAKAKKAAAEKAEKAKKAAAGKAKVAAGGDKKPTPTLAKPKQDVAVTPPRAPRDSRPPPILTKAAVKNQKPVAVAAAQEVVDVEPSGTDARDACCAAQPRTLMAEFNEAAAEPVDNPVGDDLDDDSILDDDDIPEDDAANDGIPVVDDPDGDIPEEKTAELQAEDAPPAPTLNGTAPIEDEVADAHAADITAHGPDAEPVESGAAPNGNSLPPKEKTPALNGAPSKANGIHPATGIVRRAPPQAPLTALKVPGSAINYDTVYDALGPMSPTHR